MGLGSVRSGGDRRGFGVAVVVALAVLLAAEVALRTLSPLPPPAVWNDTEVDRKAAQLAELHADGMDVPTVYVGSSIIDAAVAPELVAAVWPPGAGYNAALEGADGRSIAGWTTEVVDPLVDPQLVVMGISPRELNDNGRNQLAFAASFFDSRGWRAASGDRTVADVANETGERVSVLLRSRSRLRDPASSLRYWLRGDLGSWSTPNDPVTGRLLRHDEVVGYTEPDLAARRMVFNDFNPDGDAASAVRSAVEELHRRGVVVVLVAPPVVGDDLAAVLGGGDVAAAHATLESIARSACAPLVDLRDAVPGRSAFADNVHVNAQGVRLVSAALGARLRDLETSGALRAGCR